MSEFFRNERFDKVKVASIRKYASADMVVPIYFTPRSGSSWLADVFQKSDVLGTAREYFNPATLQESSRYYLADNMDDYIDHIQRLDAVNGVFSFEITPMQLNKVFGDYTVFRSFFPGVNQGIVLIREDIVLQAVSLYKAVQTNVWHSAQSDASLIAAADAAVDFDSSEIRRWVSHINEMEIQLAKWIAKEGPPRLIFSYEQIMALGEETLLSTCAKHLGLLVPGRIGNTISYRKIGTDKNVLFRDKFVKMNESFMNDIELNRLPLIELLNDSFS